MSLFIDKSERRLHALWRILLFFILFLIGSVVAGMVSGLIATGLAFASGTLTTEAMMDPAAMQAVIMETLTKSPLMLALTTLFSGLVTIVIVLFAGRFIDKRKLSDFGIRMGGKWWLEFIIGLALGAVLMLFIFLVELAAGWITITGTFQGANGASFISGFIGMAIVFLMVGIYEELMTRGYLLVNMSEGLRKLKLSPRAAIILALVISSAIFGMLHLNNPNTTWISTLNLSIAGIFLGLGMVLTGRLGLPIGLHITWNFFQGVVFGFPVSGTTPAATVIAIKQGGPDLWTGGAFGPEAGLLGLLAMAIGTVIIIVAVKLINKDAAIKESLAIYEPRTPLMVTEPAQPVEEQPAA